MRADGTDTFASLLSAIASSALRSAEMAARAEAHLSHMVSEHATFRQEVIARLDALAKGKEPAKAPPSSSPLTVESMAKLATNLTTITAALAKAWGPALVVAAAVWAAVWRVVWPWLRSVLGLG